MDRFSCLKNDLSESFERLKSIVEKQTYEDWETTITAREFGTKTRAATSGRVVSHTTYHAGQLALIKNMEKHKMVEFNTKFLEIRLHVSK